jgi:hypothetical protein
VAFSYICILYPCLGHPLHYSPSSLTPLLKMTVMGFNVPYAYMYRKYPSHVHHLLPSSFILPSSYYLPLNMTCFTLLSVIVLVSIVQWDFALAVYLEIYCTLISQTPSNTFPYLFPQSYTDVIHFNTIHSLSFFLFLLP